MRLGEDRDELRLGTVRVLELVDEHEPESRLQLQPGSGRRPDEPQREVDLVPEIDESVRGEQFLVARVRAGQFPLAPGLLGERIVVRGRDGPGREPLRMFQIRIRRDVLVLAATEQRREGAEKTGRVAKGPVEIEVELEQVLPEEDDDLGPGQDPDIRRQPEFEGVLADDPVAERVERSDRGIRVAVRDELIDADLHLGGRLLRERQMPGFPPASPDGSRSATRFGA